VRGPTLEILTSIRQDRASLKADAVMLHANARQTLKQARFEISVPYLGKPIAFRTDGYWAKSDSLFIWQGKSEGQYARFVLHRGKLTGGFSVGQESFDVVPATPGVSVLQLLDPDRPKGGDLVLYEHAGIQGKAGKLDFVNNLAAGMSGSSQIDVLFVTSPLVSFDLADANTSQTDLNTAIDSSGSTGSMHVVGVV